MKKSKKSNVKNIYNLSPMQEGMLFDALKHENSAAYVEQVVMTAAGGYVFGKTICWLSATINKIHR